MLSNYSLYHLLLQLCKSDSLSLVFKLMLKSLQLGGQQILAHTK